MEWTEREKFWLESLSDPDYSKSDFGKEPSESDKHLLEKFKPRVIIAPKGLLPVDFYEFYLPKTVVKDLSHGGKTVMKSPGREFLKSIERNKRYYLDYTGPLFPCNDCTEYVATGYGRVFREDLALRKDHEGLHAMPIIILKYNFVFPFSGLPARIGYLREAIAKVIADPGKWHELDIHGAVHIILNSEEEPAVVLLAQHNHFRTYLIGKDLFLPEDGRISVSFAERSNEPYPHPAGNAPVLYRAVGNPIHIPYVIDGRNKPLTAGEDKAYGIHSGGREVSYTLKFLPHKDPLYVSWIPLGNREKLLFFRTFYREGPPGIDFNTLPELIKYGDLMQFWYVRDNNHEDASLMQKSFRSFTDVDFEPVLRNNGSRLYHDMEEMGYIREP